MPLDPGYEISRNDASAPTLAAPDGTPHANSLDADALVAWLLEERGRALCQVTGHPLAGFESDGRVHELDPSPSVAPPYLLHGSPGAAPFNGWVEVLGRRCYLSWGVEGYRLVHPFSRPDMSDHLENTGLLESAAGATAPNVIYGPRGAGKSLLSALLAGRQCARGWRVMHVSCIPTHDLADGTTLLHEVVPPGSSVAHAREVFDRWRPDGVVIDMEPSEGVWGFARECHLAGVRLVLSLRAPDSQSARDRVRVIAHDVSGWRFFSPWPVAPGPRLDVSVEVA